MDRHHTRIEHGVLSIERGQDWLKVGEMDAIYELVGGKTYTVQYDDRQASVAWLDTDDGELTFDVHDTLSGMPFVEEFVENLANTPLDEQEEEGYPLRTELFAELVMRIWDSKGDLSASLNRGKARRS